MRQTASAAVWVVALAIAAAAASCRKAPPDIVSRKGEPDFIPISEDDPEMAAAMRQARETLLEFVKALQTPPPGSRAFAIKKGFPAGKREEFIWLSDVTLVKDRFRARIDNEPVWTADVKLGDSILVKKEDVADWMYVQQDELVGGYTVRVLFRREPPEKQREMEREAFRIPR